MKGVILAAGQGVRLRPLTDSCPKCMVSYQGRPILDYILAALDAAGIKKQILVSGFCSKVLREHLVQRPVRIYENPNYAKSNMVYTLFCAEPEMDDDLIVSYGDIIFSPSSVQALVNESEDLAITIDLNWRQLWQARMEDPLQDAESLRLDAGGYVVELGKKPKNYGDIQGQYMGLIKFSKRILPKIRKIYHTMDRTAIYDGKNFDNMFMTSFLQELINRGLTCKAVPIFEKWLEIDTPMDLSVTL